MMDKKFILTAGMAGLVIIVAGCSGSAQQDIPAPDAGEEIQSGAIETSAEEINPSAELNEVSISEIDVDTASDEVATVVEIKPESNEEVESVAEEAAPQTGETVAPIVEIPQLDNELAEGEYRWSQLLARDSILPIYNPEFVLADEAPYDDDELVIGLEINGEAKAYAIGPLNGREMVNDTVGGIPVLVTW